MQGLALGGAVGVPGRASSVPWAPAPGTGTVPFLVLAALGRASESPGAWLTLRDWAPLPERQSLQVWGRLRVGFSDMSPGDPGATSLRAHVKNPCDTRCSSIPGGCVGTGSMLLAGRLPGRSHLMLEAAVTRKQWLLEGALALSACPAAFSPGRLRSRPGMWHSLPPSSYFSLMLQKAFWTMPLSYRRPFRGCPLALRASPNSPKMTSTSLLGSEILLVPVNSPGSLASWAPLLLFALPGMLQPGQLLLIRPQRSHHLLWGVPSDLSGFSSCLCKGSTSPPIFLTSASLSCIKVLITAHLLPCLSGLSAP